LVRQKSGKNIADSIFRFNQLIIEETQHLAVAYKANVAFYAGFGAEGLEGLRLTHKFLQEKYPQIPRIADCKRSEMGESVEMVRRELFDWLGFTAVMVTPWFGFDTLRDYLRYEENGIFVYVHDSNPSAVELQDLELKDGRKLYEAVAQHLLQWNTTGNVLVEAGATYPAQLHRIREIVGEEMPILVAGLGPQGGSPSDLRGSFGSQGKRLLANSSRGIIFAGESSDSEKTYRKKVRNAAENFRNELQAASRTEERQR